MIKSPAQKNFLEVKRRAWDSNPGGLVNALMVFKRMSDPTLINALSWAFRLSALWIVLDHPVYIPRPRTAPLSPKPYRETACTVQGMARVRSGQAAAWPLVSDRSVRRGSGVKRDFACTFTRHFSPVLVVLRSQSCLRLEGRTRTLRGPSPEPSLAPVLDFSGHPRRGPGGQIKPGPPVLSRIALLGTVRQCDTASSIYAVCRGLRMPFDIDLAGAVACLPNAVALGKHRLRSGRSRRTSGGDLRRVQRHQVWPGLAA